MNRRGVGDYGETLALRHYLKRGYTKLDANFACRYGEIDLILQGPGGLLVFAEVKTRRQGAQMTPREAVTSAKQRKIALATQQYLLVKGLGDPFLRFDVVEVLLGSGEKYSVHCIENAF